MKYLGTNLDRNIERSLFEYMPPEYADIRESRAMVKASALEFENYNGMIADVLAQLFVDTATWGLEYWERLCGFTPKPFSPGETTWDAMYQNQVTFEAVEGTSWDDFEVMYSPELAERRSAIKAKLRGNGTISKQKIKEICAAYTGGTVDVIEYANEHRIDIQFIDVAGAPTNIDVLKTVINDVLPAHLAVDYIYRYLRWSELDGYNWTWNDLDAQALTWDEFAEAVY